MENMIVSLTISNILLLILLFLSFYSTKKLNKSLKEDVNNRIDNVYSKLGKEIKDINKTIQTLRVQNKTLKNKIVDNIKK